VNRRRWLAGSMLVASAGWAQLAPRGVLAAVTAALTKETDHATHFLPLFPLGIVVFPGELVPMHIFEPRYKQLMTECAESKMRFGIVTFFQGGLASVGTEMKLERILRTDGAGNMDVVTRGLRVFRLQRFQSDVEGKLYSGGQVSYGKNDPSFEPEIQAALVQLYNRMRNRAGSRRVMAAPYPENLSYVIGHDVGLSRAQELQLLALPIEQDRQAYLYQHLLRTR
jgi:Lon protease-like protein